MDSVFKKGNRVFDILWGWGTVISVGNASSPTLYPIEVKFDSDNVGNQYYTLDGRWIENAICTLSFTDYTLDGFSHKIPNPNIPTDTLLYVRHNDGDPWEMRYFSHFGFDGKVICFNSQDKSSKIDGGWRWWLQYSLTNPLELHNEN